MMDIEHTQPFIILLCYITPELITSFVQILITVQLICIRIGCDLLLLILCTEKSVNQATICLGTEHQLICYISTACIIAETHVAQNLFLIVIILR